MVISVRCEDAAFGGNEVQVMLGPTKPVYIAGTHVEALYPVGGVVGGFGLSTIIFSYCDALQFGFVVDADCPVDPWRLADAYEREQKELLSPLPSLD